MSIFVDSPATYEEYMHEANLAKEMVFVKYKNINEFAMNVDFGDCINLIYNSEYGKQLFEIFSGSEFDDEKDLKEEYKNILDTVYMKYAAKIWGWSNKNQQWALNALHKVSPAERVIVDYCTAYGIISKWRKYKQVYKISDVIAQAFSETKNDKVSWDYFKDTPFPTLYLDLSDLHIPYHGAFIHFNDNHALKVSNSHTITIMCIDKNLQQPTGIAYYDIPNNGEVNLDKLLDSFDVECISFDIKKLFRIAINAVLYLNISKADIEKRGELKTNRFFTNKKGKRQKQVFISDVWNVGYRKGSYFTRRSERVASTNGIPTGRHMRPHIRRGHYHGHWKGSGNSKTFVLVWHEPCYVNCTSADSLPTVEHTVLTS